MEASIAQSHDAATEESDSAERVRKPVTVPVSEIGPAGDEDPGVDVDREAFELARVRTVGEAVAIRLPALPRLALPRIAWGDVFRRAFDLVGASVLLLVLSPLLLAIAIAIRLDSPGPALFRQRRLGSDRKPFMISKFRTMCDGADARVHENYMRRQIAGGGHAALGDDGQEIFKPWPDHRVTRVGRVLRSWSLDELPQLINVIRGEMSLVGFRPPIAYEVECYPDWYFRRFAMKPGMTGLWQVSGRNERSYEEMVRYDIEYVETRTWRLDLLLLLKTLPVVVRRHGAY